MKILRSVPIPAWICLFLAAVGGLLHLGCRLSVAFADALNAGASNILRRFLAWITDPLPFSLGEYVLLALPVVFVVLIVICVKVSRGGVRGLVRYFSFLLSVLSVLYFIYAVDLAPCYNGSTLDRRLDMEGRPSDAQTLYDTASYLLERCYAELDGIDFIYRGRSVMPFTLDGMNDLLNIAYKRTSETYPFIPVLETDVKYVMLSVPMTYTHLSGVYTYYTGEANLNTNFPDYSLPFTAAHEMAHQRGIIREKEANFTAFLVCIESGDPYIRYSGWLNMYEYVASALYSADSDLYFSLLRSMDKRVYYELVSYSAFFDKYRESKAAEVSDAINDSYLKAHGQSEGSKSYGLVVDLAVAWVGRELNCADE